MHNFINLYITLFYTNHRVLWFSAQTSKVWFLHVFVQCFSFFLNNWDIFYSFEKKMKYIWQANSLVHGEYYVFVNIFRIVRLKSLLKLNSCNPTFLDFRIVVFVYTTMLKRTEMIATLIFMATTVLHQGIEFFV